MQKGKTKAAVIYFRKALQIKPAYSAARDSLAKALAVQGAVDAKIAIIQKDLKLNPDDHTLHYKLGAIYKGEGKWDRAMAQYTMALADEPRFAPALKDLALVYAHKGEYKKAISSFEKMIEFWPENFHAHYYIACIYAKQNQRVKSVAWLQKAIAKGYDDWDRIRIDENLKNIRKTPYYQQIIKERWSVRLSQVREDVNRGGSFSRRHGAGKNLYDPDSFVVPELIAFEVITGLHRLHPDEQQAFKNEDAEIFNNLK